MTRLIQVFNDSNGYVRSIKLRIRKTRNYEGNRILERRVSKIVLLVEQECVQFPMRKSRKSELVQDNLVILGELCVDAPWWSAP